MSDEDPLREALRDRIAGARDNAGRSSRRLSEAQATHLYDAAIAVLVATRGLLTAGEEILRERRDKVMQAWDDGGGDDDADATPAPREEKRGDGNRERIDLTY
jgi:hypothetical protein